MRFLITGIAGQDGSILSHLLKADPRNEVLGIVRPGSTRHRSTSIAVGCRLAECDLGDLRGLRELALSWKPDRIFALGAVSSLSEAEADPSRTYLVNTESVRLLLEAMRAYGSSMNPPRLVLASSGLVFEGSTESPQSESTQRVPCTPYALSKHEAMIEITEARESHSIHASTAILYNHESPLRSTRFVTRRISMAVARIAAGLESSICLGDLGARRDWGWAPDYVRAMFRMIQENEPDDYVLATGATHSVLDFLEVAFRSAGIIEWRHYVHSIEERRRTPDHTTLSGDSSRAHNRLRWEHTRTFGELVKAMVQFDQKLLDSPSSAWQPALDHQR